LKERTEITRGQSEGVQGVPSGKQMTREKGMALGVSACIIITRF